MRGDEATAALLEDVLVGAGMGFETRWREGGQPEGVGQIRTEVEPG